MKSKHLYTLAFLLFFSFLFGQKIKTTQVYFPYPDSKKLASEYSYYKKRNLNIYHGNYRSYFSNGKPQIIAEYSNGKRIGEYKEFYESESVYIIEKNDLEGNRSLIKYFSNGNEMLVSQLIDKEEKILKRGFENGNYVLYTDNSKLEYYNASGMLLKNIPTNKNNTINTDNHFKITIGYPQILIDNEKEGIVLIGFIIEKDGTISNLNILESFDPLATKKVISVLKKIPPESLKSESKQEVIHSFEFVIG